MRHAARRVARLVGWLVGGLCAGPALAEGYLGLQRYTLRDGLPQMTVTAIVEGPQGHLWLGSQEGLSRFDGHAFEVFRHQPGEPETMASSSVDSLAIDGRSRLWIGTNDQGVEVRDLGSAQRWRIGTRHGLSHPTVRHLLATGDGALAGTVRGIDRLLLDEERAERLLENADIAGMAQLDSTPYAVSEDCRLWRLEPLEELPSPLPDGSRCVALGSSTAGLWLASPDRGLLLLDRKGVPLRRWPLGQLHPDSAPLSAIRPLADGAVMLGFDTGELSRLEDPAAARAVLQTVPAPVGSRITSLFEHSSGTLWVGTYASGLFRAGTLSRAMHPRYGGPAQAATWPARSVYAVRRDDHAYLLGTGRGLLRFDETDGRWLPIDAIGPRSVRRILAARDGGWWIGTMEGLWKLAPDGSARQWASEIDPRISDLAYLGERLWISTRNGLYWLDGERASQVGVPDGLRQGFLTALLVDSGGNLWVGSNENGLHVLTAEGGMQWLRTGNGRLANDSVWALSEHRGRIYVGTYGGGLQRLPNEDDDGWLLSERDGLSNNVVYRIEADRQQRLWLSTNRGLTLLDPERRTLQILRESDGLSNTEYNAGASWMDRDGLLHFGGTEGLDVIDPEALPQIDSVAQPSLSRLEVVGRRRPFGRHGDASWQAIAVDPPLVFDWRDRVLAATLVAIDLSAPDAARLRYRLVGIDESWVEPGRPRIEVLLNALPAGRYRLEMQAAGRAGAFGPSQSVELVVSAPPWAGPWAKLGYLLLGVLLAVTFWARQRARARRKQAHIAELNRQVAARTAELQAANRRLVENNRLLDRAGRTDPLTGVANRRGLQEWLEGSDRESAPDGAPGTPGTPGTPETLFCLLDIDDFKEVNDRLGHPVGDRVLQAIAERLREVCRVGDLVVRWGGEEFLLVLRGIRPEDAPALLQRLLARTAEPLGVDGAATLRVGCSIGVAPWPFAPALAQGSWEHSLALADRALYRAKAEGKRAWQIWLPGHGLDEPAWSALLGGSEPEQLAEGSVRILRSPRDAVGKDEG